MGHAHAKHDEHVEKVKKAVAAAKPEDRLTALVDQSTENFIEHIRDMAADLKKDLAAHAGALLK